MAVVSFKMCQNWVSACLWLSPYYHHNYNCYIQRQYDIDVLVVQVVYNERNLLSVDGTDRQSLLVFYVGKWHDK